ncbi:MAG: DNA-3-methyladenine glycosylase I [Sporolactobacillus sp.]|jgi:DNA-3-methyladenine glycosylase I|nr:DNA-3-methyladenine glycosylase I [Sporolactobacillus sp.]
MKMTDGRRRCAWCTSDPLYLAYHDREWGRPQHDARALFEMLCLEGMQAGLSWITILKRRENYRRAFDHFDPQLIAQYSPQKIDALMQNAGIIRNRRKIEAIVGNARSCLAIAAKQPFADYMWSFVGGRPILHHYSSPGAIPGADDTSRRMSAELKKRGFRFVGEKICYAFMQATGMVNDHETGCFCYQEISGQSKQ